MNINIILLLEIVYIISAVVCAVAVPLDRAAAKRARKYYGPNTSIKYFMTYGHILEGIVLGLIPVANTVLSGLIIHRHLDAIQIFEEEKHENH